MALNLYPGEMSAPMPQSGNPGLEAVELEGRFAREPVDAGRHALEALRQGGLEGGRLGLDIGNAEIITRYERWRRFDSAVSTATFDGLNRLFSSDNAVVRAVRDAGLGLVDRMPAIKQLLVTEAAGLSGDLPRLLRGEAI